MQFKGDIGFSFLGRTEGRGLVRGLIWFRRLDENIKIISYLARFN